MSKEDLTLSKDLIKRYSAYRAKLAKQDAKAIEGILSSKTHLLRMMTR